MIRESRQVRFLADNGADLQRANHNGGTCLINAVQSVPLCELLLAHGVHVNARDTQHKTALHYAIQVTLVCTRQYRCVNVSCSLCLHETFAGSVDYP